MYDNLLLPSYDRALDVMKFHYFGQLLLESNCLLLILKMFTLQDLNAIATKAERIMRRRLVNIRGAHPLVVAGKHLSEQKKSGPGDPVPAV